MKLDRHDPETFVQKSGVAIFDLGPSSRVIEVNVQPNQTKEMLTSITLDYPQQVSVFLFLDLPGITFIFPTVQLFN